MRKLRNVLYLNDPMTKISKEGECVLISVDGKENVSIPLINLEGIVSFSFLSISPALIEACWNHNVSISILSPYGKFIGGIGGKITGNVVLRKNQYYSSDDEHVAASIAKNFILGKLINSRSVLLRFTRDHGESDERIIKENIDGISKGIFELKESSPNLNELRGIEGILSKLYFDCFDTLILSSDSAFSFETRTRRPPLDPVNALLSFAYSLLAAECTAAAESVGLDPQVGFLHRIRPGRPSLALDLMEEFRPYLGDRFVLSMINNRVLQKSDFIYRENGAVSLTDAGRKTFLTAWQKRKYEEIYHPYLDERIEIGLLPYAQALLLARFLRGDIDEYPPFLMK